MFLAVFVVIFNLICYQFYPVFIVRADDSTQSNATSSQDSGNTSSDNSSSSDNSNTSSDSSKSDSPSKEESSSGSSSDFQPADNQTNQQPTTNDQQQTTGDQQPATDQNPVTAPTDNPLPVDATQPTEQTCECSQYKEDIDKLNDINQTETTGDVANSENTDKSVENEINDKYKDDPCFKTCQEEKIKNENKADIDNTVDSTSDTGNNSAASGTVETPAPTDCQEGQVCANPTNNTETQPADPASENNTGEESTSTAETPDPAPENTATINTGDAQAAGVVYNEANTNVVTENGELTTQNITGQYVGDINLLEVFNNVIDNAKNLHQENEDAFNIILIDNKNIADIENTVKVDANSGKNTAEDECGADIKTGDAVSLANIINIVNRNIVGNNWVFAVINIFGHWVGNLIVPGQGLLTVPGIPGFTQVNIKNENEAQVNNNASATANTGENSASGADASIQTGDATSGVNVKNIVNTNIVRNNWFFLMVNNMGSWVGQIMGWDEATGTYSTVYSYDFGSDTDCPECQTNGLVSIYNHNIATVNNNVSAEANTGGNSATAGGNASIKTGNAVAWVNIFNFINTNIVGNNWFFGVVNNLGKWEGNVIFAYPDLSVSLSDGKDTAKVGDTLAYDVHYKNNGYADCADVQMMVSLAPYETYKSDTSGSPLSQDGNNLTWNLSGLKAGEERSFTVTAKINKSMPVGMTVLESAAGVKTSTKETELGNNSAGDSTSVNVTGLTWQVENINASLKIKRASTGGSTVKPGDYVKNYILVENTGDSEVYGVVLQDSVKNNGAETSRLLWPLGNMKKNDKLLVQYEVVVNNPGATVVYNNEALAYGTDKNNNDVKSQSASSWLTILGFVGTANAADETVAGAQTELPTATQAVKLIKESLPLWLLLFALIAYGLTVNWSLGGKKNKNIL